MSLSAKAAQQAIRQSRQRLFGVTAAVGTAGSVLWWYNTRARSQTVATLPPPTRRTETYVAGDGAQLSLSTERNSFLFAILVVQRTIQLVAHAIPLLWFVFLNRVGLCSQGAIFAALRDLFVGMGPSYIKLGQWLASRPDIFPPEMCRVLSQLFDQAPPHSWSHTERVLRDDGILAHLSSIEKHPLNSGSVAQIHRGVLRDDVDELPAGTAVAVKVLHPGIRDLIVADITSMRLLIRAAEALIPSVRYFDGMTALDEFSSLIVSQLDLRRECDNLLQFRYNFRLFEGVVFPQPASSISTKEVLVETFEEGEPLQAFTAAAEHKELADLGCHMFLKMLFEDNFVHSDLHPGNLLVRDRVGVVKANGSLAKELVVLDAGLATQLSSKERDNFISLFAAVACGDGELGATLMLDRKEGASCTDREGFTRAMKSIFDMVGPGTPGFRLSNVDLGAVLAKIMNTVREYRTPIDGNFAALIVTVIIGEALAKKLHSNYNIFAESIPYVIRYLETSELKFLAGKLRETYGMQQLLLESVLTERVVPAQMERSKHTLFGVLKLDR